MIKGILSFIFMAYAPFLWAQATANMDMPSLDTPLNDFNPEYPIGRYIQQVSSNMVEDAVQLTNGVLTVGGESINIAEPVHVSVTTNNGEVVTNTYNAVYEDGLQKQLEEYAPKKKIVSTEGGVTNYTSVAYLSDIPEDTKKADKMMLAKEYSCQPLGVVLSMVYTPEAPLSAWAWTSADPIKGITELTLFYTNKVWTLVSNVSTTETISGTEGTSSIYFPGAELTFTPVNQTNSYVVYTTQMEKYTKAVLTDYISKSNLNSIAEEITEDKLHTLDGIVQTLKGIKGAINGIVGLPSIRFTIPRSSIVSGSVNINSFETQTMGDSIEIDWGDGTVYPMVSEPTNHFYNTSAVTSDVVTITIKGFIKSISGNATVPFIYKKILQNPGGSEPSYDERSIPLKNVTIEEAVGLQELGINTFKGSELSGKDLSFLPSTVESLGESCFAECNLASLIGMPLNITSIPNNCFSSVTTITSLEGMSPNVTSLGEAAFSGCSSLSSMNGMPSKITTIPPYCFSGTSLASLDTLPSDVSTIGAYTFQGIPITSLIGLDADIVDIGDYAFYECDQLTDATALQNTRIAKLNKSFADCSNVETLTLPTTITNIEADALARVGNSRDITEITFNSKSIDAITNITSESGVRTFAWDLPNNGSDPGKTLIKGTDGTLRSMGNGTWELASTRSSFTLRGVAQKGPATVELGIIETPAVARDSIRAGPGLMVDWGDGTINSSNAHTYAGSSTPEIETQYTISILGKIDSIAGRDNKPFITVDNQQATPYLTSVTFGNAVGLKEIGDDAFVNCPNLSEVKGIYNTVTALGNRSFKGCYAFTNTDFLSRSSIAALPTECFASCTNLVSIDGLPDNSLSSIGDGCFSNCLNLVTLGSPKSVTYLGKNAFNYCLKITNVSSLVASVNTIAEGCFQNCGSLSEIGTLAHVTSIGARAFAGCPNITTLTLGSNATIGDKAFYEVATSGSVAYQKDEDNFNYKLLLDCSRSTYVEAAEMFGLQDGSIGDTRTGIDPLVTKIVCSDGILYYNQKENTKQWEISMPAIEIELQNVPNGMTFIVQTAGTRAYQGAALIWNWGDGTVEQWITDSPAEHTYVNSGTSNYVIKVKGLLESISSLSEANGTYIRPKGRLENPYLVGYKIAESSPIKTIGRASFSRCPKLKNIDTLNLPKPRPPTKLQKRDASKSRLEQLSNEYSANKGRVGYEAYVFYKSGIQDMSGLPDNLGVLSEGLFQDTQVTDLSTLHDNVTDIEDSVFRDNSKLQRLYGFPSKVGYISNYAFANCTNLETLTDLKTVPLTTIGEGAFAGNTSLQNLKGISNSVTSVGPVAFGGSGIFDFNDLSTAVTNIADGVFLNCLYLTNGIMGSQILSVGDYAFQNCGMLVEPFEDELGLIPNARIMVDMPCEEWYPIMNENNNTNRFLQFICQDGYVVWGDSGWRPMFKSVVIHMDITDPKGLTYKLGNIKAASNQTIRVIWGDGTEEEYRPGLSHTYSKFGGYKVELIGEIQELSCPSNFYPLISSSGTGNPYIVKVSVGEGLSSIVLGDRCFKGCSNLTSFEGTLYTKDSGLQWGRVKRLGEECFADCISLTSLTGLSDAIEIIGDGCFAGCTGLTTLDSIPRGVTKLPADCFAGCTGIEYLYALSNNVISVFGARCFRDCTNLKSLVGVQSYGAKEEGTNLVEIGEYAFANCTSLTNLEGLGSAKLNPGMFYGCDGLLSLQGLSPTISEIPAFCFHGCTKIKDIPEIPLVEGIGDFAFYGCTNISSLEGLSNVVTIGNAAFSGCHSLVDLQGLTTNLISIGNYAFASNRNLIGFGLVSDNIGLLSPEASFTAGDFAFAMCPLFLGASSSTTNFPIGLTAIGEGCFKGCDLSSCLTLGGIKSIPENCFDNTCLTNLLITLSGTDISADAFANYRNAVFPYKGLSVSRVIKFTTMAATDILKIPMFPWGSETNTFFECSDGYVLYHDGKWDRTYCSMSVEISVSNNNLVSLTGINQVGGEVFSIDWGDGDGNFFVSGSQSHTFPSSGDYLISVLGNIQSLNRSNSNTAFINGENFTVKNLYFGNAITNFYSRTFFGLSAITNFPTLTGNMKYVGPYCFGDCSSLPILDMLQSSLNGVGKGVFSGCGSATNAIIPRFTANKLADSMFENCEKLENISFLEDGWVETIGSKCFSGCESLSSLSFNGHTNLSNIGESAFENCTSLCTLEFNSLIDTIGENAFYNIGSGGTVITNNLIYDNYIYKSSIAFLGATCNELLNKNGFPWGAPGTTMFPCIDGFVVWDGTQWEANYGSLSCMILIEPSLTNKQCQVKIKGFKDENVIISWGDGAQQEYEFTEDDEVKIFTHQYSSESIYNLGIRGEIKEILGTKLAQGCLPWVSCNNTVDDSTNLIIATTISSDSSLQNIGAYAFYGCSYFRILDLTDCKVTNIGEEAFGGCQSLISIVLPSSVTNISSKAFSKCLSLQTITLYSSDLVIGEHAILDSPLVGLISIQSSKWPTLGNQALFRSLSNDVSSATNIYLSILAPNIKAEQIDISYSVNTVVKDITGLDPSLTTIEVDDGNISYVNTYWKFHSKITEIKVRNNKNYRWLCLSEPIWIMKQTQADPKITRLEDRVTSPPVIPQTPQYTEYVNKSVVGASISKVTSQTAVILPTIITLSEWEKGRIIYTGTDFVGWQSIPVLNSEWGRQEMYCPVVAIPGGYEMIFPMDSAYRQLVKAASQKPQICTGWPWAGREGDSMPIEIDWGDNRTRTTTSYAQYWARHEYWSDAPDILNIRIKGEIYGLQPGGEGLSCVYWQNDGSDQGYPAEILSVKIGNGVGLQSIEEKTFQGVTNIVLSLPETLTTIGDEAFAGYSSITDLTMLSRCTSLTHIGKRCFMRCPNLTTLNGIPPSIQSIGDNAFASRYRNPASTAKNLDSVSWEKLYIPSIDTHHSYPGDELNGLKDISALTNCTNLTFLGESVFAYCPALTNCCLPSSLTNVPPFSFFKTGVTSLKGLPNSIITIEPSAFAHSEITSLEGMPQSIKELVSYKYEKRGPDIIRYRGGAFQDCNKLKDIAGLSPLITSIPDDTFVGCDSLPSCVVFPKTVESATRGSISKAALLIQRPYTVPESWKVVQSPVGGKRLIYLNGMEDQYLWYRGLGADSKVYGPEQLIRAKINITGAGGTVQLTGELVDSLGINTYPIWWGDGQYSIVTNADYSSAVHSYNSPGVYTIVIVGTVKELKNRISDSLFSISQGSISEVIIPDFVGLEKINTKINAGSLKFPTSYGIGLGGRPYTSNGAKLLPGYPWGCTEVKGVEDNYGGYKYSFYVVPGEDLIKVPYLANYFISDGLTYYDFEVSREFRRTWEETERVLSCSGHVPDFRHFANCYYTTTIEKSETWYGIGVPNENKNTVEISLFNSDTLIRQGTRGINNKVVVRNTTSNIPLSIPYGAMSGAIANKVKVNVYETTVSNKVDDSLFKNFVGLTEMPNILEGKEIIGESAFEGTRIAEFGTIPASITNIGEKAFASAVFRGYHIDIQSSITNLTIGKEAFGDIYPFGITKKVVEFPNIEVQDLVRMPNFPFATMYDTGTTTFDRPHSNYTNDFNVYRCKGGVEVKPVNVGTESDVEWVWMW